VCDTLVVVRPEGVLFAKNSDRDPNEAQLLDWHPRRRHPEGATVRCTWIEIPQVAETNAVLLSRPFWIWGAEMGSNEHGVTIGNEAVFTRQPLARAGLTGMDLLRLALERAASARSAVEVIVNLLERHGQGGGCGHEDRALSYHSSFLVADPLGAYVLETAGRFRVVEEVHGARSISNGLSIPGFARRHGDLVKTWFTRCRTRRARTEARASEASGISDLMAILRDHGEDRRWPRYALLHGCLDVPCMHGGGLLATAQTTASWVADLRPGGISHWVTGTAAPCLGLFKPVRVDEPLELGAPATDVADETSLFWRHEWLHRRVIADPQRLAPLFIPERDATERAWIARPPLPGAAFAEADRLLERWSRTVACRAGRDLRPPWVRRYWRQREARAAGIDRRWRRR
jgi:secernin